MRNFLSYLSEEGLKPKVITFGRFQGLHVGHEKLINKVKSTADEYNAPHEIIASATHDTKKNPLTVDQKVKHMKRAFPDTNITAATKEEPTLMHAAARINREGHDHLIMVAGEGRDEEYDRLLKAYNGKADRTGKIPYKFKKITVVSAGVRDPDAEGVEGASGSNQRKHVMNNDFDSFKKNLPSAMKDNHAKELFRDIQHGTGMSIKESVERFYQRFTEENFVGTGQGVMGLGHAEGDDVYVRGEISKYAAANASDSNQGSNLILKLMRLHDKLHKIRNKI
jgi:cytidyltransferase-like protein